MYGSIRWLIGLITLYILLCILGNTLDQQSTLLTTNQTAVAQSSTQYTNVQTQSNTMGTTGIVGNLLPATLDGWQKMLTWDFSFWYDYDAFGNKTDSPWKIIYYIVFVPLTGGMIILLLQVLRQLLLGW